VRRGIKKGRKGREKGKGRRHSSWENEGKKGQPTQKRGKFESSNSVKPKVQKKQDVSLERRVKVRIICEKKKN